MFFYALTFAGSQGSCMNEQAARTVASVRTPAGTFMKIGMMRKQLRPNLNIFLFPLTRTCFTGMGWSVGIFFNFSNSIPSNLIVYIYIQ